MSKVLVAFFIVATLLCGSNFFAAEAKRSPEWDKVVEAAKKEGKIVIAIPLAAELRKEMEAVVRQKLGLDAELVPNPAPRNASRIAAKKKAGVSYFDALIVGTGTALSFAREGMLEALEPLFVLPVRDATEPALERADDVVDQPRFGRADVRRRYSAKDGAGEGQSLPAG